MSTMHWFLLVLVVAVVGAACWYLRRHSEGDPWHGMEDDNGGDVPADDGDTRDARDGVSLNGDSYIVGVRKLASSQTASADNDSDAPDPRADAARTNYKNAPQTQAAPEPQPAAEPAAPRPSTTARVDNIQAVRPPAGEENIFVLHVAAREGSEFAGPDVHAALDAEGLKFGLHDLYHRVTDANGAIQSVYCVASMLKPGVLDPDQQHEFSTPGLALFLVLPGAIEGRRAMHDMMETANAIAQRLGGDVLDDKRSQLKAQTAQYMLDEIAEIDRRARLREAR